MSRLFLAVCLFVCLLFLPGTGSLALRYMSLLHALTNTHVHLFIQTHKYTLTHTHTHTHTHTLSLSLSLSPPPNLRDGRIGHNWGSPHDSSAECAPGGESGNYIMFPSATDGTKPNNRLFSPCSRSSMASIVRSNSGCFDSSRSFCGNGIVEADELCDCGDSCDLDPCCTTNCTIVDGLLCSPQDPVRFPCCTEQCMFVPKEASKQCQQEADCLQASVCGGNSATCPLPGADSNYFSSSSVCVCVSVCLSVCVCVYLFVTVCLRLSIGSEGGGGSADCICTMNL